MKKIIVILIVSVIFSACKNASKTSDNASNDELTGEITISGAFALYPLAVQWADAFKQEHPKVRIDVSAGGAGKGMTDVLANMVDIGMVSREVYPAEIEKGAYPIGVAIDAVVPTMSSNNPLVEQIKKVGLTKEKAIDMWLNNACSTWESVIRTTGSKTQLNVYTRSDACGAAETFAAWLGSKQENLGGTAVFGDPGLAKAVQDDPLGAGYNNLGYAYDEKTRKTNAGLEIIPLDINGNGMIDEDESFYSTKDEVIKAIAAGKYPSPPARELYLVTNGKPSKPALVAFIKYVLTKGQELNIPAGYISITEDKLLQRLEDLENK